MIHPWKIYRRFLFKRYNNRYIPTCNYIEITLMKETMVVKKSINILLISIQNNTLQ